MLVRPTCKWSSQGHDRRMVDVRRDLGRRGVGSRLGPDYDKDDELMIILIMIINSHFDFLVATLQMITYIEIMMLINNDVNVHLADDHIRLRLRFRLRLWPPRREFVSLQIILKRTTTLVIICQFAHSF